MALSIGNITTASGVTNPTTTFSHNNNGNALIVFVCQDIDSENLTGITYGGRAMLFGSERFPGGIEKNTPDSVTGGTRIYSLVNPSQGANDVVMSWAVGSGADSHTEVAVSFLGADTGNLIDGMETANGNSAGPVTLNINTSRNNTIVCDCAVADAVNSLTVGAGQTQRMNFQTANIDGAASTEPKATAGTVTMSWTLGSSGEWAVSAIGVREKVSTPKTIIF